jgi:hypothetical protein
MRNIVLDIILIGLFFVGGFRLEDVGHFNCLIEWKIKVFNMNCQPREVCYFKIILHSLC